MRPSQTTSVLLSHSQDPEDAEDDDDDVIDEAAEQEMMAKRRAGGKQEKRRDQARPASAASRRAASSRCCCAAQSALPTWRASHRPAVGALRVSQVVAAKVEIPEGWTPPVFPKSDEATAFLKDIMSKNKLMKVAAPQPCTAGLSLACPGVSPFASSAVLLAFACAIRSGYLPCRRAFVSCAQSLAPSDRDQLIAALEEKSFSSGTAVITEGDAGDIFYILDSGSCSITIGGNLVPGGTIGSGASFGELALLHNAPRAATVTCTTDCKVWALDGISFKTILMGKSQQDAKDYLEFLGNIPLLKSLTEAQRTELASHLKESEFSAGKVIVAEGDPGNSFYIIRSGEVNCTTKADGQVSVTLTRGKFFGELALLHNAPRAATVTATTTVQVLTLDKEQFTRLLGPLKDLISEETKELYTVKA